MSKDLTKQFIDFKKRNSLSNEVIKKIMVEYANSDFEHASSFFCNKYDISKSIFYKLRDYAVIFCIIDEDICKQVKRKTIENYKRNNPNGSTKGPVDHFSELYVKRQQFINTFSDNEIKDIAYKYAEGVSTKNIAFAYDIGEYGVKMLLKKGIVLLIVDEDTTKEISLRLGSRLDNILEMRQRNKQKILDCVRKEIEALNAKIEIYDLYYRDLNGPSKEELQTKLKNLMKKEQELLR